MFFLFFCVCLFVEKMCEKRQGKEKKGKERKGKERKGIEKKREKKKKNLVKLLFVKSKLEDTFSQINTNHTNLLYISLI